MNLTAKQIRFLRSRAHKLKPVVIVGNAGLSNPVLDEIEARIEHHELIKVRLNAATRDDRHNMIDRIQDAVHAIAITKIGHVATFYRPARRPVIKLP